MDRNDGFPSGHGRGGPPVDNNTELRRPLDAYHTYTAEFVPSENRVCPRDIVWRPQMTDLSYTASSSEMDLYYRNQCAQDGVRKPPQPLSPFAKEFVPRNFRPPVRNMPVEMVEQMQCVTDPYPVQELRAFLNEITMNPGKFERKIQPLTDTLNSMVDDDETMRAVVNTIFDESVRQPNLRYSGARLCKCLCNDLNASPDRLNFRSVLLTRCNQEFKRREVLAQAEDGGTYLRGFAMFMAELFSQLDVQRQRITVLGDNLPNLIKTILNFSSPDNLKCACQILKLVGAFLDDYERMRAANKAAPEMDSIMMTMKQLAATPDIHPNICDLINSVIKLRESDWGRSSHTENSGYETCPPSSVDEPVMYGPDGKPMTADELMFLQTQYASSNVPDPDDYDVYDDARDDMDEEISEAYEEFLREQQESLRH